MENNCNNFNLPIAAKFDVVVSGGGCAGVTAAIAAARNGAKTLLIERENYLGGMLTGGLVHSLHGYRLHRDYMNASPLKDWSTPLLVEGITMEILKRLKAAGGTNNASACDEPSVRENFDEEIMIRVLDQMVEEAGVTVLFNAIAFGVVKEGNAVSGVRVASKSGAQIVKASVVIDCSGDGDLCVDAGCEYEYGSPELGVTHGAAMLMEVGGIDIEKTIAYLKERPELNPEQQARFREERNRLLNGGSDSPDTIFSLDGSSGKFNMAGKKQSWDNIIADMKAGRHIILPSIEREWVEYVKAHPEMPLMPNTHMPIPCYPKAPKFNWVGLVRNGSVRFDQTMTGMHEMFVNQSDGWALSEAIMLMRKINFFYFDFLQTCIPGFENSYIIKTSPLVGTRESRRITGDYTLTAQDCENGTEHPDAVALCGRACNIHHMNGQNGLRYWVEPKKAFTIPYRCLVPKGVDGILAAGRCSSTDFIALGATRSMPTCMSMGEAAGAAAALCVRGGYSTHNINISELQRDLRAQGVLLPQPNDNTKCE